MEGFELGSSVISKGSITNGLGKLVMLGIPDGIELGSPDKLGI
jgi:hypothetical protein